MRAETHLTDRAGEGLADGQLDFHRRNLKHQPQIKRKNRLMKQRAKYFAAALAVASGMAVATSAQAQIWTLSDFHNFNLSVTYGNWNVDGSQPINGGSGFTPVITSGPTSYEVMAQAYGSGAYNFASPINASGANQFQLTFTINSPAGPFWMNPGVDIADGTHLVHLTAANTEGGYLDYSHYSAGTYTVYGPLHDQFGGSDLDVSTITAFNLELDPAEFGGNAPYDITYNSLVLTTAPEPTTLALLGIGAAGLVISRRRAR